MTTPSGVVVIDGDLADARAAAKLPAPEPPSVRRRPPARTRPVATQEDLDAVAATSASVTASPRQRPRGRSR
jgi:hypothetical protein